MAETRLILIRHGETEWNREGRIQGYRADSPLTENGHVQASRLAARLASEGPLSLHSSDSGRARQTVTPIAAALGLDIAYDAGLRERNYGVFEGRTYVELESEHPEAYRMFRSRDPAYAPPGGESGDQFRDRIMAALGRVAAAVEGGCAAVITHGGVLGVAYRHIAGMSPDSKRDYALLNASLNRIVWSDGRWSLESWGDVAHLSTGSGDSIEGA